MSEVTSVALADHLIKSHPVVGTYHWYEITVSSTLADNADSIKVLDIPPGNVVTDAWFSTSATLGVSCTVQLRVGTTAISAATTAGGADSELQTTRVAPSTSEQALNFLVGGADVSAGATIKLGFQMLPAQSVSLP
jgi:hypothetical protein